MAKRSVVAMPGDGIGQAVLPQARRVLDAVGFDADYVHADIGWEFWNQGCKPRYPSLRTTRRARERNRRVIA